MPFFVCKAKAFLIPLNFRNLHRTVWALSCLCLEEKLNGVKVLASTWLLLSCAGLSFL